MYLPMAKVPPIVNLSAEDQAQLVRWKSTQGTPQQVALSRFPTNQLRSLEIDSGNPAAGGLALPVGSGRCRRISRSGNRFPPRSQSTHCRAVARARASQRDRFGLGDPSGSGAQTEV